MKSTSGKLTVVLYGEKRMFEVRTISAPHIMVVARDYGFKAGEMYRGKPLPKPLIISTGRILHSQWIGEGENRRRIYHVSDSLYGLVRTYEHAIYSAAIAQRKLTISNKDLVAVCKILARTLPLTPAQRKSVQDKLLALQVRFENARREVLRSATERVEAAVTLKDKRGRYNPSAFLARLIAVGRRYGVRFVELEAILPNLAQFRNAAVQELSDIWQTINECDRLLSFIARENARVSSSWNARTLFALFSSIKKQLPSIKVDPFYRMAMRMEQDMAYAFATLINNDVPQAKRASEIALLVARMRAAIKFKRVQRALERVIYRLSMSMHKGTLTAEKQTQVIAATRAVMARLGTLDERGFKVKRLARVRALLGQGVDLLWGKKFERAKQQLKAASVLL